MKEFNRLLKTVEIRQFAELRGFLVEISTDKFLIYFATYDIGQDSSFQLISDKYEGHGYTCSHLNRRVLSRAIDAATVSVSVSNERNGARL